MGEHMADSTGSPAPAPGVGPAAVLRCSSCGTEIGGSLLSCPVCHSLVHARALSALAEQAQTAEAAANPLAALTAWRQALELLPTTSRQHAVVLAKVEELTRQIDQSPDRALLPPPDKAKGQSRSWLVWVATAALFIFSKGKLLALGLTKLGTVWTMLLSFGVYWTVWGWKFAAGLVLSIYVHEMGHVAALRRFGVPASAPMFIPGLGAVVRLKAKPTTAREDARVGLAGPIWGLGAALACWGLAALTDSALFLALAKIGAWINLFNLLPVWQLDGSRGFRALTRWQRWTATGAAAGLLFVTADSTVHILLAAIALIGAYRSLEKDSAQEPDHRALAEYICLIAAFTLLASLHVPV